MLVIIYNLSNNFFSWTPQFQLFGTNNFINGEQIKTTTNTENCGLGMICILDNVGLIKKETSGGTSEKLTIDNQYGAIHSGVKQLSTGINGMMISTPIYVSESKEIKGDIILTPNNIIRIWFEQNIETSMMISSPKSNSIELDFNSSQLVTCRYKNQTWSII